ncbi:MAG: gamma-glutamyl-gamma-aminobutyrate hydrolase family protein [Candidatus Omnitrophica bacterium]|nr:gamma-glutamyl-gamma-aminobutyrate hydrolase family protein [Candidatus Omnitrophota bacterium]
MRARRKRVGKPVIGITCEVHKIGPYYSEFDLFCDYRYVRAIIRAGGNPVLLPINPFRRDVSLLLDGVDGVVIVGGMDIHPSFYGERSGRKVEPMYRGRTYFDMNLYRLAQKKEIPVLAICYGMQLLNVIFGGSLFQDIKSSIRWARRHRSRRQAVHRVEILPGSHLHKIFRRTTLMVHSDHHQAIKIPGRGIEITAFAEDGVAEAAEGPPHTVAVQWHPERQPKDPVQMRLFRHFIRLARRYRMGRGKREA